jgi:SH3-like domain-containing protein
MIRKLSKWIIAFLLVFSFSFSQLLSSASAENGSDGGNIENALKESTITLSSDSVKPGDSLFIKLSGANLPTTGSVELHYKSKTWFDANAGYESSNDNATAWADLDYNKQDGVFEGYLHFNDRDYDDVPKVSSKAINGTWVLDYGVYYGSEEDYDLDTASSFTVSGGQDDVAAPTVNDLSLNKNTVNAGEQVTVTADASDNNGGTGIDDDNSYVLIGKPYKDSEGYNSVDNLARVYLNNVSGTSKYEGNFTVPKSISSDANSYGGKYYISSYHIVDKSGNEAVIDNKFINQEDKSLTVNNTTVDTIAPEITAISTDQDGQQVETGHAIHVSVTASDDKSGISNKKGDFSADFTSASSRGSSDGEGASVREDSQSIDLIYNPATQKYEGIFIVPLDATLGQWRLDYIYLSDNAGNATSYNYYYGTSKEIALLASHKFTVVKDVTAPAAPKLDSVNDSSIVANGSAEAGSTITLTNGKETWTGKAEQDGRFSISIPKQAAGTTLTATAKDAATNVGSGATVTVEATPIPIAFNGYLTASHAVRTAPSSSAQKLGSLKKGAVVQVIEAGKWDKILYNGQIAYVYGDVSQKQPILYTAYLTKSHAVRKAASKKAGKAATLKAGSSVKVLEKGQWTKISYKGSTYYIWGKDLKKSLFSGKLSKKQYLRSKASAKSHKVKALKKKTSVKVLTKGEKWDKVVASGKVGYVLAKTVKK